MPRYDFRAKRLFLRCRLAAGEKVSLDRSQSNHLVNVLRLGIGDRVRVFNGRDGEWMARITAIERRNATLAIGERTRPQTLAPDLYYLFAPLKHARLDYMAEKATEMGASLLWPVITRHTQVARVNLHRLEANATSAAEQCGILSIPQIRPPLALSRLIEDWPETEPHRRIIFCDEGETGNGPLPVLRRLEPGALAVLVGPEGGFSPDERDMLRDSEFVTPLPLGPRILRADTAAIAALALVQASLGDWRST